MTSPLAMLLVLLLVAAYRSQTTEPRPPLSSLVLALGMAAVFVVAAKISVIVASDSRDWHKNWYASRHSTLETTPTFSPESEFWMDHLGRVRKKYWSRP